VRIAEQLVKVECRPRRTDQLAQGLELLSKSKPEPEEETPQLRQDFRMQAG
jgi:hypothetical protein